jgi:hypothetical protein
MAGFLFLLLFIVAATFVKVAVRRWFRRPR